MRSPSSTGQVKFFAFAAILEGKSAVPKGTKFFAPHFPPEAATRRFNTAPVADSQRCHHPLFKNERARG